MTPVALRVTAAITRTRRPAAAGRLASRHGCRLARAEQALRDGNGL